ncbi:type III pantothenate kinase [Aquifex pyrophilus]
MRRATVDIGNTTVDILIWNENKPEKVLKLSHEEFKKLEPMNIPAVAVSVKPSLNTYLFKKFKEVKLIKTEDIPIEIIYKTPETLGTDRVIMAFGAKEFYGNNVIVVSAGTALVIDLVLDGKFYGGFITLGVRKKLETLFKSAEGIPELSFKDLEIKVGQSTKECVLGGVIKEAKTFVRETIKEWREYFKRDFKVVITGGDGKLLKEFGIYDEYLIHKGIKLLSNESS